MKIRNIENCPFCKLDLNKTIILEETNLFKVIFSNPALVKSHILIIPNRHVENISELNKEELEDLIKLLIKFQSKILKRFSGCDIRQNYRPFQKQNDLKVNHLHIHLQPREFEDELYKKCQIFEKNIFKQLSLNQLKEQKEFLETCP